MKNLLKSESFRFRTTPLIWIIVAGYAVLSVFNGCLTGLVAGNVGWLVEIKDAMTNMANDSQGSLSALLQLMQTMMTGEVNSFNSFIQANASSNLLMALSIFVGVFCLSQKSTGYIKNMLPFVSRKQILSSNLIHTIIFTLILDIAFFIAMLISWKLFFVTLVFDSNTPWYLCVMVFVSITSAIFIYGICDMFKNPKTGMIIAIIYTAGVSKYLYKILDIIFSSLGSKIKIETFLPMGLLSAVNVNEAKTVIICMIMALVYGGGSLLYLYRANKIRDY